MFVFEEGKWNLKKTRPVRLNVPLLSCVFSFHLEKSCGYILCLNAVFTFVPMCHWMESTGTRRKVWSTACLSAEVVESSHPLLAGFWRSQWGWCESYGDETPGHLEGVPSQHWHFTRVIWGSFNHWVKAMSYNKQIMSTAYATAILVAQYFLVCQHSVSC